jgi:hypothetical protein
MRAGASVPAADGSGSCRRSVRVPAGDGAGGQGMREAERLPPAAGSERFGHGLRLFAGLGETAWRMCSPEGLRSAGSAQSSRRLRMPGEYSGERRHMRQTGALASEGLRSTGSAQSSRRLRMPGEYGGERRHTCVKRERPPAKVCDPPARLNRRGACVCPPNTVARGNTCVERERRRPPVQPDDIIRFVPRFGPGGGRDHHGGPHEGGQGPFDSPGRR